MCRWYCIQCTYCIYCFRKINLFLTQQVYFIAYKSSTTSYPPHPLPGAGVRGTYIFNERSYGQCTRYFKHCLSIFSLRYCYTIVQCLSSLDITALYLFNKDLYLIVQLTQFVLWYSVCVIKLILGQHVTSRGGNAPPRSRAPRPCGMYILVTSCSHVDSILQLYN
jgi:hypothetical protein